MLVPLAAKWGTGGVFRRRLGRRQDYPEVRVGWGHHERWTLPQNMDQEAAGRIAVFCRERAVCRSQDRVRRAGDPEHRKGHGNIVWDLVCTWMPRQQCAWVDMQNLWIQEASKVGRFVMKKVGTNVNPADLMTKALAKPKIEQLMSFMGYEFLDIDVDSLECRLTGA